MKRILCIILMVVMMAGMFASVSASTITENGAVSGSGGGGSAAGQITSEPCGGYIYRIEEQDDTSVVIYMYGDDGYVVSYNCADSVTVNGRNYSEVSKIAGALEINVYATFAVDQSNRISNVSYTSSVPEDRKINAKLVRSAYNGDGFTSEIAFNYALKAATAYLAVYDWDGKLISFSTENIAIGQETLEITTDVAPGYNGLKAKIMFWDRGNELKPLGNSFDVTFKPVHTGEWMIRGVLTENFTTNLYSAKNINKSAEKTVVLDVTEVYGTDNEDFRFDALGQYIGIDEFLVGDTDAEKYLGHAVAMGVDKTDDGYKIVTISEDGQRDETLTIRLDQYASHTLADSNADGVFRYYEDGANVASDIAIPMGKNFNVVLNGMGIGPANLDRYLSDPCNFDGEIELINNDGFAGYDAVIINLASVGVVDEVYEAGVIFKNDCVLWDYDIINELEIDETDNRSYVKIIKNGAEIQASELQENDVLAVYAFDYNSNYIYAEVVTDCITGTIGSTTNSVTSAYPSSMGLAYSIDGEWYDVAECAYGTKYLDINAKGAFYLGKTGKIVAFMPEISINYGYVLAVAVSEPEFGSSEAVLKIQMLSEGGVSTYIVMNGAKVECCDGMRRTLFLDEWIVTGTSVTGDYGGYAAVQNLCNQVIQYETNSNGGITLMTESGYDYDFIARPGYANAVNEWDAETLSFANGGSVFENAKLFIIDSEVSNCRMGSLAELEDENRYQVLAAYSDSLSNDEASVIVLNYASVACVSMTSNLAVVSRATDSKNSDGEDIWTITYLYDGEEITCDTNADVAAMGAIPQQGDIIKVKVGPDGIITSIAEVWTDVIRRNNTNFIAQRGYYPDTVKESFVGGVVENWEKDYKDATIGGEVYSLSRAENVYVIDATGRSIAIKNGSAGSFKNFAALYGSTAVDVTFLDGSVLENVTPATARGYADHIYLREYDGEIIDVVIVKGFIDRVTANS